MWRPIAVVALISYATYFVLIEILIASYALNHEISLATLKDLLSVMQAFFGLVVGGLFTKQLVAAQKASA